MLGPVVDDDLLPVLAQGVRQGAAKWVSPHRSASAPNGAGFLIAQRSRGGASLTSSARLAHQHRLGHAEAPLLAVPQRHRPVHHPEPAAGPQVGVVTREVVLPAFEEQHPVGVEASNRPGVWDS